MQKIACIMLCIVLNGCAGFQLYYIKDAKMIDLSASNENGFIKDRSESIKLLLNGHYVDYGNNLVLLIRKFDPGSFFSIDDEKYEKITIEIKSYTVGTPINVDSPDMDFYYSSGSSGFISKGHGVYSSSCLGTITINEINDYTVIAELDLTIWAVPAGPFPFEGKKIHVNELFSFKELKLSELSPWIGIPDTSIGNEVYPWKKK